MRRNRKPSVALAVVLAAGALVLGLASPGSAGAAAGVVGAGAALQSGAVTTASGTLTITGPTTEGCPIGYDCSTFTLSCGSASLAPIPDITGRIAMAAATTPLIGVIELFTGASGEEFWGGTPERRDFVTSLRDVGYETIEIAWDTPWGQGVNGLRMLACRPAVTMEWAAGVYAASGATPPEGDGTCGFCVVGQSVGSSQVTHPFGFYGVADFIDAAIVMAGPAHADITAGCRRNRTPFQYLEPARATARDRVDDSYDNGDPLPGPCASNPADLTFSRNWKRDGVATTGAHLFPTTRMHFVWGSRDNTGAVGQGELYLGALAAAGTPMLDYDCLSTGHDVAGTPEGRAELLAALQWVPADGFDHIPPLPAPQLNPRCVITS